MSAPARPPLAVYRYAAGLTQSELAKRAGISRPALVNIERGRAHPRLLTIRALADALGVDPDELFPTNDE
jgi:putative transcriptional regulator